VLAAFLTSASATAMEIELPRATLVVEDGALTDAQARRFAGLIDQGIADVDALLRPVAQGRLREGRVTFRVMNGLALSTTRGRTVSLLADRVRSDSAPYLHETTHVLLPAPHRSVWLTEGFASYVESYVAENVGGYDARVFTKTGNRGVDREASRWLARGQGVEVLPYVGQPGEPPEMREERRRVAAPFYVLSHSFTRFLVERLGLAAVVAAVSSRDPDGELARRSGRDTAALKREWLAGLSAMRMIGSRLPQDPMSEPAPITRLLQEWRSGDRAALDRLTPLVYDELRRLARAAMKGEKGGHVLQATALVHEAYLRLLGAEVAWQDRVHFYSVAARMVRRILVDHARAARSDRRGGALRRITLHDDAQVSDRPAAIEALDDALERLAAQDERKARIVELHFFGGLTYDELAEAVGVSAATVDRDLRLARAWLKRELAGTA
jgi:RNA polymerase sigma factor (TIGR02999 family)